MSHLYRTRTLAAALATVLCIAAAPVTVEAGVDEAERRVEQVLQELDGLRDQLEQIDLDYGEALARQDELAREIQESQARIDDLALELAGVQSTLTSIALDRFTSGDSLNLSPIFSDATTYSQSEQRAALAMVAIDTGQGDTDTLHQLADALAKERESLESKQEEATSLIAALDQQRIDFQSLEEQYIAKEAQARAELGEARMEAEEAARAAAEAEARAAADAAAAATAGNSASTTPRGGGGNTGGNSSGGSGTAGPVPSPPPTNPSSPSPGPAPAPAPTNPSPPSPSPTPVTPSPAPAAPPVSSKASIAVSAAYSQLGVPYKFATASPGVNFDCSGLTKYAWGRAGVSLPHQSGAQYAALPHVSKSDVQPGDLIFYYSPIGHVGIYVGNGQLIHAPQTGDVVKVSAVNWGKVVGIGRPG